MDPSMFASAFLQVAFERLATPILLDFKRACSVEEALDDLEQTLTNIRALLIDADRLMIESQTDRIWLRDLEAVAYEADDVVDEFYYAALRQSLEEGLEAGATAAAVEAARRGKDHGRVRKRDKMKRFLYSLVASGINTYQYRHDVAERIKELNAKFEGVNKRQQTLSSRGLTPRPGSNRGYSEEGSIRRQTSSLITEPYVFGRKPDVEQIVKILLSQSSDPLPTPSSPPSSSSVVPSSPSSIAADRNALPVLPIIGIAGLGKTTLAQLVYNDERVKKNFDLLIWICVSNCFDLQRLTRQIFENVATPEEKATADSTNLNVLQTNLRRKLDGKRFLLVLDDLWNHDRREWHTLRAPLLSGKRGSAVLVTTRHDIVAEAIGTMDPVLLQGLSLSDCHEMLLRCACVNGEISNSNLSQEVCRRLVEKIKGVPLAIKTLGNILSFKRAEQWEEILERNIWELQQSEGDILPVLKLSYEDLPPHLKRCFAYCSLFPEDHKFDKLKLVKLWMAQDFILSQGLTDRMEDTGSSYFDELLKRSFFQKVDKHYIMHSLYHGLAQSIQNDWSVRVTEQKGYNRIQDDCLLHMSFSIPEVKSILEKIKPSNHLRSFIYTSEFSATTDYVTLELPDSFSKLKYLRVLDLTGSSLAVLPEFIGSLIHLRFMDISQTQVEGLPDSLSQLYNLQCLELEDCPRLKMLSTGLQNLINLRHLNASDDLVNTLPGIGKLTSLQELKTFNVSKGEGHRIQELENLNELRDKLWIRNIQHVETNAEVTQANLKSKIHLLELVLEWSMDSGSCGESSVGHLELLQPPLNLKVLSLIGNGSLQPPSWMSNYYESNLTSIHLRNCRNWKSLPSLGALHYLEYLRIEYLSGVKEVGAGPQFYGKDVAFPSLKALEFRHLDSLKKWEMPSGRKVFPCLEKLVVEDCPELESVPLPSSLKILKVEKCAKLQTHFKLLQNQPSLHSLYWSFENNYLKLRPCIEDTLQHLSCLEGLDISFCHETETNGRWLQRPSWMKYSYSQRRAEGQVNSVELSCLDSIKVQVFLLYAYMYPDYPDVNCRDLCLRIRNDVSDDDGDYDSMSTCLQDRLVSLRQLSVNGCEKIDHLLGNGILSCSNSLTILNIENCKGMMSLEWLSKHKFVTLTMLKITNCPDMTSFPPLELTMLNNMHIENSECLLSVDIHGLVSLKSLAIIGCSRLKGVSISGSLRLLEKLKLKKCTDLILTLDDIEGGLQSLMSLKMLELSSFQDVRELPANLKALVSLENLTIKHCPEVRSLPEFGLPGTLNELRIEGCPLLQEECKSTGSEWPKVSYIPKRTISCHKCSPYKCSCSQTT